jgi:hypothetical protein
LLTGRSRLSLHQPTSLFTSSVCGITPPPPKTLLAQALDNFSLQQTKHSQELAYANPGGMELIRRLDQLDAVLDDNSNIRRKIENLERDNHTHRRDIKSLQSDNRTHRRTKVSKATITPINAPSKVPKTTMTR